MARNEEDLAEFRQDMLEEAREDEIHQLKMHTDYDYFLKYVETNMDIEQMLDIYQELKAHFDQYGYELDINDFL